MNTLFDKINLYEQLTSIAAKKKPKVIKFKDGMVINGEFGSPEVDKILDGIKLPLIIADFPYGILIDKKYDADWDRNVTCEDYIRWTKDCDRYLCNGGSLYAWGGIGRPGNRVFFEYLASVEKETGMSMRNLITWSKRRGYGTASNYLFCREEAAWLIHGSDKPRTFHIPLLDEERGYAGFNKDYPALSKYKRRTNVWSEPELFAGKSHVAQKPERLAEIMIETHTRKGETIMDPFAGSGGGSSGLAARTLGRRFILIEKDKKNFDIIVDRIKNNKHDKIDKKIE